MIQFKKEKVDDTPSSLLSILKSLMHYGLFFSGGYSTYSENYPVNAKLSLIAGTLILVSDIHNFGWIHTSRDTGFYIILDCTLKRARLTGMPS